MKNVSTTCDTCRKIIEQDYCIKYISYTDDGPNCNGNPSKNKSLEICSSCNERIVNTIYRTITDIKKINK